MKTREAIMIFITEYFEKHCYAPSFSEICKAVGKTKSCVHHHMHMLFDSGLLETDLDDNFSCPRAFRPAGYTCKKAGVE